MTNRLPMKSEIQFELEGKHYRKFINPIDYARHYREFTIDKRVIINPKEISATTFYSRLKEAKKNNSTITILN